jgi:hypothetical protein
MVSIGPGNREGPPGSLTEPPRDIVVIGASRGGVEALNPHSPDGAVFCGAMGSNYGLRYNILCEIERGSHGGPGG